MLGQPWIDAGLDEDRKTLANWRWIAICMNKIKRLVDDWQVGPGLADCG